jgi:hypothetical protein
LSPGAPAWRLHGLEDIRKAKRYLEMYEKYLQGDKEWWR